MATKEILERAQIEHIHGGISRTEALQLETDCERLLTADRDDIFFAFEWDPVEEGAAASITTRNYPLASLLGGEFQTLEDILLRHHPFLDNPDANILVNKQEPGATQVFHPDIVRDHQLLIYASDGGAFDFYPSHDASDFETIDVNAGDFLKLAVPYIRHRGRNPSSHTRYTLVLSQTSELD